MFHFLKALGIGGAFLVALVVLFALAGSSCSEDTDPEVNQAPCLQSCEDFDLCFGFEGTGETLDSCQANCQETNQAENDCVKNCESIADCDQWLACIQGC